MSYRFMRVIVMFDLPVESTVDRREYRKFRKFLLENGFMMLQESIYCKLALNATVANAVIENVRKQKPAKGLVHMLTITERQFARMELVTGEYNSSLINSDERILRL